MWSLIRRLFSTTIDCFCFSHHRFDSSDGVGRVRLVEKQNRQRDPHHLVGAGSLDGFVDDGVDVVLGDTAVGLHDQHVFGFFVFPEKLTHELDEPRLATPGFTCNIEFGKSNR